MIARLVLVLYSQNLVEYTEYSTYFKILIEQRNTECCKKSSKHKVKEKLL